MVKDLLNVKNEICKENYMNNQNIKENWIKCNHNEIELLIVVIIDSPEWKGE